MRKLLPCLLLLCLLLPGCGQKEPLVREAFRAAQEAGDRLAAAGVKGLWNFTNYELNIPQDSGVVVESVHFSDSLLALSYMISQSEKENEPPEEEPQ